MNTEKKRNWMIWAIIALVIMNLSTLATILYHQYKTETPDTTLTATQWETKANKFSGRYFRDKLNLDASQMNKFREINPGFRRQVRSISMELDNYRKEMMLEMTANSDTNKLNALSDSIGQLHSHLKKLTYRYYLDLRSMCTPEQQKQLEQLFSPMFASDAPLNFQSKGSHGGKHGRRMNQN